MENFINSLYLNNIEIVLKDFTNEEYEDIKKAYYSYLTDSYSDIIKKSNKSIDEMIRIFSEVERKDWEKESKESKQRILLKDQAFENLGYLSDNALKHAMERLKCEIKNIDYNPKITKEQAYNYIKMMEEEASKVKAYNFNIAKTYLSEGTVDYLYASGISDNYSLRVGRMK